MKPKTIQFWRIVVPHQIEKKIAILLEEYRKARFAYFNAVGMPGSFKTPEPSNETMINKLEIHIGQKLPLSYREFLMIQDGFPEFDGETSIMNVEDMTSFFGNKSNAVLKKLEKKYNDHSCRNYIIFGRSNKSISMYLFDPMIQTDHGEWKVLEFDEEDGINATYTSFRDFLNASVQEAIEAKKEAKEGEDLFDMDF